LPIPWFAAWEFEHSRQAFHIVLSGKAGGRSAWDQPIRSPSKRGGRRHGLASRPRIPRSTAAGLRGRSPGHESSQSAFHVPSLTGSGPIPDSLRELARALGAPDYQNRTFGFDQLMFGDSATRDRAHDNRRLPLARRFTVDSLGQAADMRDGSNVAVELYRLRNGDVRQQERYEQITATFARPDPANPKCSIGASAFGRPWGRHDHRADRHRWLRLNARWSSRARACRRHSSLSTLLPGAGGPRLWSWTSLRQPRANRAAAASSASFALPGQCPCHHAQR